MNIVFAHGKESGPWGTKIKRLADIGRSKKYSVESIDYSDTFDPDERVARLLNHLDGVNGQEYLLVGSSMGAYVSLVAAETVQPKGVFLLAPALYIPSYKHQTYNYNGAVEIVHGWADEVISPDNSIRYAQSKQCSLHLIDGDHRLNSSIEDVEVLFSQFIGKLID